MLVGKGYISRATVALMAGGTALLVIVAVAVLSIRSYLPPGEVGAALSLATDVGSVIFGILAAAVLCVVPLRFRPGNPFRQIWLLFGLGVAAYAIGDVVWTALEVRSGFGAVPYPSVADALYLSEYAFLGAGIIRAAGAFRRTADVRKPMWAAIAVTIAVSIGVYMLVAAPVVADPTASLPVKVLGVAYPIGDIVIFLGPALFIAFAAGTIGRTQVVWQWWVLAAGLAMMAVSDIAFTWLDWTGRYAAGHPVDFGWMLSLLMIAVAGSLSADAARGPVSPSSSAH